MVLRAAGEWEGGVGRVGEKRQAGQSAGAQTRKASLAAAAEPQEGGGEALDDHCNWCTTDLRAAGRS